MNTTIESFKFEAEVQQVLHLVIHSLYSNRDVFLRELISNASDACDKLRFEALAKPELMAGEADLRIDLDVDVDAGTLSVVDNGIGMNRSELIENLGTIARSGTRKFLERLSAGQKADANLIGQFGVGFYSAFIVADRVVVETRRAGEDTGWRWASDGAAEFTLEPVTGLSRGTRVTLHLKEDAREYLQPWKLRALVTTWSDHIAFPVSMPVFKDGKPTRERETVNQAKALWTRPKSEITDDEYRAFYKHLSHDFEDPLAWTHNKVEGNQNFTSLLYVPARAPFDFQFNRDERKGLKLYVKRVFIMDAAEHMLPAYLRFVRGVVDSDDLPLNVSREMLQNTRQLEKLRSALSRRVLDLLDRLAGEEPEKYRTFWNAFGNVLKEGLAEDFANRERIAKLLRFASTCSSGPAERITLDEYVARMKPGQDAIYYLTADGWNAARNSPQLEALKAREIEVLLLHERIDEWMIGYLHEYAGKPLKHVAKGELDVERLGAPTEANRANAGAPENADAAVREIKKLLGERVREVRVSRRLTQSPACIVLEETDMALHMQRLLKAAGHEVPAHPPVLEINPGHALVQRLMAETDSARREDLALLLLEEAILAEGGALEDPAAFVARVNRVLVG